MNFLTRFLDARTFENPATPLGSPDPWLVELVGGGLSSSGIRVTTELATTYAAIWRATSLIAGDVGKMPFILYERKDAGKIRALDHPAYSLLKRKPNSEQTAFELWRLLMVHALLTGNGYAFINRDGQGRPVELWPMSPHSVTPVRDLATGKLTYVYHLPAGQQRKLEPGNVIHIKGFGYDGLVGYSFIAKGTESIGYGLAMRKYSAVFFRGSARPSVILEHPKGLSEEKEKELKANWDRMHSGLENQHKTAVLFNGMKAVILPTNARDAQLIESRRFEVSEIANFFGLPPHLLGDPARSSFRSLEEENRTYLRQTLDTWLVQIEMEVNAKLLSVQEQERDTHFAEFLRDSLIQIDTKTRTAALVLQVNNGLITLDEARAIENRPALPNGQGAKHRIPLNIGVIGEPPPVKPQPGGNRDIPAIGARDELVASGLTLSISREIVLKSVSAVFQRMNDRIGMAAARAAKRPEKFVGWIEDWLERQHGGVVLANVAPAIEVLGEHRCDAGVTVGLYFEHLRGSLLTACECSAEALPASIEKWRSELNAEMGTWFLKTFGVDEHVKQA